MNYNPSTIARIGDIVAGLRVDSGVLGNSTYLARNQVEDFNVYGRILLLNLFMESITNWGAQATLFQYTYSCLLHTGGAIASTKLGLVSSTLASMTIGGRVAWTGGAVGGSNHLWTDKTGGVTDLTCLTPAIIGYASGVSTIGHLTTIASQLSGTHQHSLFYVPISDGAYVEAVR